MQKYFFDGKICAVLGLARSGIPSARFLAAHGGRVVGYDNKTRNQLSAEALDLENAGVELITGEHHFEGIENASLIVLSPGLNIHREPLRSLLRKCTASGAEIIGELELATRFCPAPIIAVTSTKGKSTTVKLIAEILQALGHNAIPCGNTGSPLMDALPKLTPESWTILEVSSFQLESVSSLKPRVAVLLNLLEDHQDYHPSLEQYWQTKMRLFERQDAGDCAILNSDEMRVMEYAHLVPPAVKVLLTSSKKCEKCVVAVQEGMMGWQRESTFTPVIHIDKIPLHGTHNRANVAAALAAIYAALGAKVLSETEKIASVIANFAALPHRLEIVASGKTTWVNDSQATIPDASSAALHAFDTPILLIAGGHAKLSAAAYQRWAADVAQYADYLLTIGEAQTMMRTVASAAGMAADKIIDAGNLETAVQEAAKLAPAGATIIMSPACASFDQFANYVARGDRFRELARALSVDSIK